MNFNLTVSQLFTAYKDWVCKNPQLASDLESTFKWISYFVAGKINNSAILTEWVYSVSNLLVLFNDQIIESSGNKPDSKCNRIKIWLTVLEYSEVFIEISAKKLWGQKGRKIIIVWVQILKCFGRLTLLLRHRERILSCPPIPPLNRAQSKCSDRSVPDETSSINNVAFSLKRSGRVIRKVGGAPPANGRLWKPPVSPNFKSKSEQTRIVDDEFSLRSQLGGEALFIVKPVIHLAASLRYGKSNWKPWLLSLAMDLLSLHLHAEAANRCSHDPDFTAARRIELSRRRLALVLYLMRSPFYERHTKARLDAFLDSLAKNIPLARLICNPIKDYIPYWQDTYFYMWSS